MAGFRKDKTGSAQTAANAAAVLTAAFADSFDGDFDAAVGAFHEVREDLFKALAEVVDADNELFEKVDKETGGSSSRGSKSRNGSSSRSGGRSRKTKGGSGGFDGDLADALKMKLKFGAFEGETLKTVLNADTDTCVDDYDYGDGERDGRDYISWLAGSNNQNSYVREAARLIADDEGIEYDD